MDTVYSQRKNKDLKYCNPRYIICFLPKYQALCQLSKMSAKSSFPTASVPFPPFIAVNITMTPWMLATN